MAQLVARLVRNEKVGGSNPPSSTTGRHPIRMSVFCMPGRCCGGACCCVACGAAGVPGAACALLGRAAQCAHGRRPSCFMLLVAPRVFRAPSGPAAREIATREPKGSEWSISKPARALRALRHPPHQWCLVADVWLGASSRGPARPRRRPRAPQPGPATAHGHRGLALRSLRHPPYRWHLVCGCVDWLRIHLVCGTKFALLGLLVAKAVQSSPSTHETRQNGPFRASRASFIPHMQ